MRRRGSFAWSVVVFAALLAAGALALGQQRSLLVAERRASASARAAAVARDVERHVASSTGAAHVLATLVRARRGDLRLEHVADDLLRTYPGVRTLQLQPGGVVRHIYPLDGNEAAIGTDLFHDPARRASAVATRDSRRPTLDGPRPFVQGGIGAVVRVPVFLSVEGGDDVFWGFTAATTRFRDLLRASRLDAIDAAGFRWSLTSPDHSPLGSAPGLLRDPVRVDLELPNARWQLALEPVDGWNDARGTGAALAACALLAGAIAGLVYRLLRHPEELRRKVRERTEALHESEQRFRQLVENSAELFWIAARGESRLLYASPAFARVWGVEPGDAPDRAALAGRVHPDDRALFARLADDGAVRGGDGQYRVSWPDGSLHWIHERTFAVRDASGEVVRVAGIAEDVSERRALEQEIRQAQKMDAVGQLAGGIAHDFNNLLCVVSANTALMLDELDPASDVAADAREVRDAVDRASALTRQLLAFSRRQLVQPRVWRVADVVADLTKMLRRLIGEAVVLQVEGGDAGAVRADRGQLEQVIVNLVVNARDAMPRGGEVTIRTSQEEVSARVAALHPGASAGRHTVLEVKDTGCGMDAGTLAHVFEPFFTTKPPGKGTGLGLATVYGIVSGAGGFVIVDSAPGRGTTVRVHLPCCEDAPAADEAPARASGGHERLLLVEDEPAVRAAAARLLRRLGYAVAEAAGGLEAIALVEGGVEVDLLVTDVVMPGMGGAELVERLRDAGFAGPVLFMTGYAADPALVAIARAAGFVQKPFTAETLGAAVRDALGAGARARAATA